MVGCFSCFSPSKLVKKVPKQIGSDVSAPTVEAKSNGVHVKDAVKDSVKEEKSLPDVVPAAPADDIPKEPEEEPEPYCGTILCGRPRLHEAAPVPLNEVERKDTLYSLNVLDSEPDSRFDDVTRLLCTIFKVPIAIVSLVDTQRQWFKSIVGLPVSETDRSSSFCAWTLLPQHPTMLVVEDALKDARFKQNPLVLNDPLIRFYAGAPLVSSVGYRLGSLCVIDRKPRKFSAEQCNVLANFAEIIVRQIEKTSMSLSKNYLITQHAKSLLRALNCFSEGLMLCQMTKTGWKVLYVNDAWNKLTDISVEEAVNKDLWELFTPSPDASDCSGAVKMQTDFQLTMTTRDTSTTTILTAGGRKRFVVNFRPAHLDPLDENMPLIGIPANVIWERSEGGEPYYFATVRQVEDVISSDLRPFCEVEGVDAFPEVTLGPLLGKGSFGKVYRGVWKGVPVAVKVIHADNLDSIEGDKPSARLEAAVSMSIAHPNIVQTYKTASRQSQVVKMKQKELSTTLPELPGAMVESGANEKMWRSRDEETTTEHVTEVWILLEFCDMGTLIDGVEKGWFRELQGSAVGGSSLGYVLTTAREVASAMRYLHSQDIVHGDLSGGNVLLCSSSRDPRGFVSKVTDFGLSRIMASGVIKTETFGTATHMPPELLTKGLCSKSVDVYAYGVLLWEMWNGKRAWAGMHQLQVIFNVTVHNRKLEFEDDVPPQYKSLAHRCMEAEPENRPTFEDVLSILDQIAKKYEINAGQQSLPQSAPSRDLL